MQLRESVLEGSGNHFKLVQHGESVLLDHLQRNISTTSLLLYKRLEYYLFQRSSQCSAGVDGFPARKARNSHIAHNSNTKSI